MSIHCSPHRSIHHLSDRFDCILRAADLDGPVLVEALRLHPALLPLLLPLLLLLPWLLLLPLLLLPGERRVCCDHCCEPAARGLLHPGPLLPWPATSKKGSSPSASIRKGEGS